jgi:hypothetical protein
LKSTTDKVTVEILDPAGMAIRTLVATKADAEKPKAPLTIDDLMDPQDPVPSVAGGLQRFEWDLRYDRGISFPGLRLWAASTRGPIAPPGDYRVRVTADGQTQVQGFPIKRDPHILADVTDDDLRRQFELASQIHAKANQANEAILLIRGIRPQIADRIAKVRSNRASSVQALQKFDRKLSALENQLYQVNLKAVADPINFPIKLNNKIASLQAVVESADAAPTAQSYTMFELLSAQLQARMVELNAAVTKDLPVINGLLRRRGVEPIASVMAEPEDVPMNDQRSLRRALHL